VSFLFTDVEGSTKLWEADRDAMAASLAVHDKILRKAAHDHDGHVFSTAGDAFSIAFASAEDAVAAALDAQLTLMTTDWPGPAIAVRMGIHTGTADERDGDYFGPTLNRAARIMSAGHGGQILLSSVTAALAGRETVPLGSHRLKDLAQSEELFEVRHPDLPTVDRLLRTADTRGHNLPEALSSFVGREHELAELAESIATHRLTVLTGVGGTGKTRLALQAAHRAVGDHADGTWLVELAPITDPDLVMAEIGDVWGLRPGEGIRIEQVVLDHLRDQELLLVVDNCEHVLGGATAAIRAILEAAPDVTVLATSRESLGLPGEHNIHVPSLGLDPDDPGHSDAVALFTERVREVRPDFDASGDELDAVVRICRRIDGIPLGLELAAARLRSMSAGDLADRLEESFRILSGSAKTALPRQRTLQATIDWSHDLLEPAERAVFRRAAMFAGGFDLEAAEAVCAGGEVEGWAIVDHLDSLVDKSLLEVAHGDHTRFRLLEPIRQYAQEQLQRSGESATVLRQHADHFRALVAQAAPGTRGPDQMAWDRRLDADIDNVRAALRTFLEEGEVATHLAMAFDLYQYWMHVSLHVEAIETMHAGIAAAPADLDPELLVKAYFVIGVLGAEITDPKAIEPARRGLEIAESIPDPGLAVRAHLALGAALVHSGNREPGSREMLAGQALFDEHPEPRWWEDDWETAHLRFLLSAYLPPDEPRKEEHATAAIAAFERLGDRAMLAATLIETFTIVRGRDGFAPEAAANIRRALDIIATIHLPYWAGHAHKHLGWVLMQLERWDEAADHLQSSLDPLEDCGDIACWINAGGHLARSQIATGRLDDARARLRSAAAGLARVDDPFLVSQIVSIAALAEWESGNTDRARSLMTWLLGSDDEDLRAGGEFVSDELGSPEPGEPSDAPLDEMVRTVERWMAAAD
jgi:predicted ATPase